MPVLSLSCSCGHAWEAIRSFSTADPTLDACPECGKANPIQISAGCAAFAFTQGYDYENAPPLEKQMALSNKRKIEANAEMYLDGRASYVQPKGVPKAIQPQVPDHLKKNLY